MTDERKMRIEKMRDDIALRQVKIDRAGKQKKEDVEKFQAWYSIPENAKAFQKMRKLDMALSALSDRPAIIALRKKISESNQDVFKKNHIEAKSRGIDASGNIDHSKKVVQIESFFEGRRFQRVKRTMAAAAVLAASFLLFWVAPYWQNVHQTEAGEIRSLVLDDKTKVILDTDTKLRVAYKDSERRVYLIKGQAYFDVASMPDRPFIVHTEKETVTAVGTAFAVKYDDADLVVLLKEGKVDIAKDKSSEVSPVRLEAGQQWQSTDNGDGAVSDILDVDSLLSWTSGRLIFRSESLRNVIEEVNKYSDIKIKAYNDELLEKEVDAVYKIGKTQIFIKALAEVMDFKFNSDAEGNIVISGEDK